MPTLEDYEKLVLAYQDLQSRYEIQSRQIQELTKHYREKEQEVQIRDEVLKRQSDDIKRIDSELMWTKAALQQTESALKAHEAAKNTQSSEQATAPEEESWQERYQQLQAEVDGLRKRWEQRYNQSVTEARNQIMLDMLPLADHLDLALTHAESLGDDLVRSFVENIESTRRAFMESLRRHGIERMDALGQSFDPNLHEAIGHVAMADVPANHVAQVVQAGYVDGDHLLRPARVVVSAGAE
jgi:molecular chaperone GrpE